MLAFLLHSPGFTPGVRPARSARSSRESPVAMRVEIGGVPIEEFASYRARFPKVAEAFERLESTLEEIKQIEQQNIQKRVSCPEPAPRRAHSAPFPTPSLTETVALAGGEDRKQRGVERPDRHGIQGPDAVAA